MNKIYLNSYVLDIIWCLFKLNFVRLYFCMYICHLMFYASSSSNKKLTLQACCLMFILMIKFYFDSNLCIV